MKQLTTLTFIERAQEVHGDKYDYSETCYFNSKTQVKIICPDHGGFYQIPTSHTWHKSDCPQCSDLIGGRKRAKTTNWFIRKAKQIHGNMYDYTNVTYKTQQHSVIIGCQYHGSFNQRPGDHIYGKNGCPKCGDERSRIGQVKPSEDFILEAKNLHGSNTYDYSNIVYKNNSTKVNIGCKQHGLFLQTPQNHLTGSGCPNCAGTRGEKIIMNIFQENNINYIFQHKFDNCVSSSGRTLSFDFYIPERNLLVEFDGELHHKFIPHFHKSLSKFKELKHRDEIKNIYAKNEGYNLIRVTELNCSVLKKNLSL